MKFDREKFFDAYRQQFGSLTQDQVVAIEQLLAAIEDDRHITDLRHIAYILATIRHESANTFEPIKEIGKGRGHEYGKVDPETGKIYYGRGYVQLTWRRNYELLGKRLDIDLVNNPDLALEPDTAWVITSEGMRHGLFTGKDLNDYINEKKCDYVQARRIINGLDRAELIAGYAKRFEVVLKASIERAADEQKREDSESEPPSSASPLLPPAEDPPQQTAAVTVKDGAVTVETSGPATEPERVAVEKPAPLGFAASMKKKISTVVGGNVTLQVARDYAEQGKALGLSPRFWMWVSVFAVVGGLVWLAVEVYRHWLANRRELEITKELVAANSTPQNTITLADSTELPRLKAAGYKIVTR